MRANRLTNVWLAKKMGVSRQMIAYYRTTSVPGTELMQELSSILGVPIPEMTGDGGTQRSAQVGQRFGSLVQSIFEKIASESEKEEPDPEKLVLLNAALANALRDQTSVQEEKEALANVSERLSRS